jgi:hypothetical protein
MAFFGMVGFIHAAPEPPLGSNTKLPEQASSGIDLIQAIRQIEPKFMPGAKPLPPRMVLLPGKKPELLIQYEGFLGRWQPGSPMFADRGTEFSPLRELWLARDNSTLIGTTGERFRWFEKIDWSQPVQNPIPREIGSEKGRIGRFVPSPDGSLLLVPMHKSVQFFEVATQKWLTPLEGLPSGSPILNRQEQPKESLPDFLERAPETTAVALAPNQRTLAYIGSDSLLRVYSLADRNRQKPNDTELWRKRLQPTPVRLITFSPDGTLLATAVQGKTMILDALTGRHHKAVDREFGDGDVSALCFSPDQSLLVAALGGEESRLVVIDVLGNKRATMRNGHHGRIESLVFLDAHTLASASAKGEVFVWDFKSLQTSELPKVTLADAFNTLDHPEMPTAISAMRTILSSGQPGLEALRVGLDNSETVQAEIAKWIKQLDNDEFRVRENARKKLIERSYKSIDQLQQALKNNPTAETQSRIKAILTTFENQGKMLPPDSLYGERLIRLRAVQLLEQFPGAESRKLLETISRMTPDSREGIEARMILERTR